MAEFPNNPPKTWIPVIDGVTQEKAVQINTIYDEVTAIETYLSTYSVSAEISLRASGDTRLSTSLSSEVSNRLSGDLVNSSSISVEVSNRTSADNVISTSLSSEVSNRLSGDLVNSSSISTESSARLSADTILSAAISTEASVRASADALTAPILVNYQTISDDKTIAAGDPQYQMIQSDQTRTINLPSTGLTVGLKFFIKNCNLLNALRLLTVVGTGLQASASQICNENMCMYMWNGSAWESVGLGFSYYDRIIIGSSAQVCSDGIGGIAIGNGAVGNNTIAIGKNANASGAGGHPAVAIGNSSGYSGEAGSWICIGANATTNNYYDVVIGRNATGTGMGNAIGYASSSNIYGVAVGPYAATNGMNAAIAKGSYSQCERWNEEWKCADVVSPNKYGYSRLDWFAETADATPVEIFLGGTSNQRATVLVNSAYMFSIQVIAYDNTNTTGMTFKIEGGIRRGASTVALIGTPVVTTISQDGTPGWSVAATADDTNKALILTVTGASATIRWNAMGILSECRF